MRVSRQCSRTVFFFFSAPKYGPGGGNKDEVAVVTEEKKEWVRIVENFKKYDESIVVSARTLQKTIHRVCIRYNTVYGDSVHSGDAFRQHKCPLLSYTCTIIIIVH